MGGSRCACMRIASPLDDHIACPRCADELNVDVHRGKKILASVLNGGRIPPSFDRSPTLLSLQRASGWLRWLACTLLPDVDEKMQHAEDKERTT